ncbi:MAG: cytochrome b [Burkholderiales bacterium]
MRYTRLAVVLHWLLAVALVMAFGMGLYMADLPVSPRKLRLYNWHKWAGVTILALSFVRLGWRLTHPPPADPPMPPWQRKIAQALHHLLYLLFFAVPLVGWAHSSAAGFPVVLYGVLPLPDFVPVNEALSEALEDWHAWLAWAMAGLVLLHTLAALKHHFVDRDALLARMGFKGRP